MKTKGQSLWESSKAGLPMEKWTWEMLSDTGRAKWEKKAKSLPYVPRPVRGVSYPGYIRINRAQLKKLFSQEGFLFSGFLVGNKVNSFHFFKGWSLACALEGKNKEEMESALNSFCFYLEPELGSAAAIFLKMTREQLKK